MAPADMPSVIPPIPKYRTIKITLKSPVDIPKEFAMPESTPPSMLSFNFLCMWDGYLWIKCSNFLFLKNDGFKSYDLIL